MGTPMMNMGRRSLKTVSWPRVAALLVPTTLSAAMACGDTDTLFGGHGVGGSAGSGAAAGSGGTASTSGGGSSQNPLVGNCVIDDGEQCDDCNASSGDGCDDAGQLEPGWDCPHEGSSCLHVSGFASGTLAAGGLIGSAGGYVENRSCLSGDVLVGIRGENASNCGCGSPAAALGSVEFLCATVEVDEAGQLGWTGEPTTLAPVGGEQGIGQPLGDALCPHHAYLVGMDVLLGSSYGELAEVSVLCAPFMFEAAPSGGSIVQGTTQPTNWLGSAGGASASAECSDGSVATTMTCGSGAVLNRVEIACAPLTPTYCGDGVQDEHEGCDDGNAVAGDGCDVLCQTE